MRYRTLDLPTLSLICLLAATVTTAGCSGDDGPSDGGTPDSGTTTRDGGQVEEDAGAQGDAGMAERDGGVVRDAGPMTCAVDDPGDLTPDPGCTADWVVTVAGTLEFDDGTPVDDGRAQICIRPEGAPLTCLFPEPSCPDGTWEVLVPENARCIDSAVIHAFEIEGDFADTYCDLDVAGGPVRASFPDPFVIFETNDPVDLPAEGDSSLERTVVFEGDLEVDVTPDHFFEDYTALSALRLGPNAPDSCIIGPQDDFDAVWGFSPSINIDDDPQVPGDPGFPFRIANTGLAEGVMVDLYVQGSLDCALADEDVIEEGHWALYDTVTTGPNGVISGDLPCFNWFAYKAR